MTLENQEALDAAVSAEGQAAELSATPFSDAAASPAEQQAAEAQSVRDAIAAKYNWDASQFQSDEEFADALATGAQQYYESQPLISAGQKYLQHAEQFERWLAEQSRQQQAQQQQTAEAAPKWKAPEFDPSWKKFVEFNPALDMYQPIQGYPQLASFADKLNAYRQHEQNTMQRFVRDPLSLLNDAGLEDFVSERVNSAVQQVMQHLQAERQREMMIAQTTAEVNQYEQELYQLDDQGRRITDARGNHMLTDKGKAVIQYMDEGRKYGINHPQALLRYAYTLASKAEASSGGTPAHTNAQAATAAAAAQAATQDVSAANQQQKQRFVDRITGARRTNRNGAHNNEDASLDPRSSFEDLAMDEARRRGLVPSNA